MWEDGRFVHRWRRHQAEALAAFESSQSRADHNHYIVLPPGAGKTHLGLEIARRLGRDTVVLCPNTAIQGQWLTAWSDFRDAGIKTSASRHLPTPLTVLTYQSVASFDPDAEVDEEGRRTPAVGEPMLTRLHDNGRALVERLRNGGPWTIVLDECHHLLDVWGRLLVELLHYISRDRLDRVVVIGLTATPASRLTPAEHEIVQELFGDITYSASTPAVVKSGHIAPYQELALLTEPTAAEREYIKAEAERFAELVTDLLADDFGSVPFLAWCDTRFVRRAVQGSLVPVRWELMERQEPDLAAAAIRLHIAGLLDLPHGARIREEHRRTPDAEDWAALIGDWVRHRLATSTEERDVSALDRLRHALPSVGYQVTRRGVRAGRSPVERVLARSAAKATAVLDILGVEHAALGERLRAVVISDHERASAQVSASLRHVLAKDAGSAYLVLERLIRDPTTAALQPILMTARTVACSLETARHFTGWLRKQAPSVDVDLAPAVAEDIAAPIRIDGRWTTRQAVALVTRFFEEGQSQVLVGTRGLLGEGWDAKRVNVVIDLTTATTSTAVVQLRGRAVRLDPDWDAKVANTWTVVTIADDHPKGATDYARFVIKHDGFFAPDADGQITSGVAHVDAALSPYGPPPPNEFTEMNTRMRARAIDRARARKLWRINQPYEDVAYRIIRIRSGRQVGLTGRELDAVVPVWRSPPASQVWPGMAAAALGAVGVAAGLVASLPLLPLAVVPAVVGYAAAGGFLTMARLRSMDRSNGLANLAAAVAEGLHRAGVTADGASAVEVTAMRDGSYRATLRGSTESESVAFAEALDEVLSPLADPRYVISRAVIDPPHTGAQVLGLALRRGLGIGSRGAEAWHAVPTVLATRRDRAEAFLAAWRRWVGPSRLVYAHAPEGAGILAAQRGEDPFAITTAMRTIWR
jgi:superfamily II DNA or RNA helicase